MGWASPRSPLDGLVVGTFYALKDVRTPVLVGIVGVAADIVLAWVLMRFLDHVGIAASISVIRSLKVAVLLGLLRGKLGIETRCQSRRLPVAIATAGVGMVLAMAVAGSVCDRLSIGFGRSGDVFRLMVVSVLGVTAFIVVLWAMKVDEIRAAVRRMVCTCNES